MYIKVLKHQLIKVQYKTPILWRVIYLSENDWALNQQIDVEIMEYCNCFISILTRFCLRMCYQSDIKYYFADVISKVTFKINSWHVHQDLCKFFISYALN